MSRNLLPSIIVYASISLLTAGAGRADDSAQATTDSRLRDAYRGAMQQLQDAQGQLATAQATEAQSEADNAALKAKVDAMTAQIASLVKQSADDKAASDKAIADLKSQNGDLTTQIGKLNDALTAWEKDDKQYVQLYKDTEAARAQLAVQVILLQRTIDDRETKNLALFNLGNEILTRYEKFSLGDALGAKEPFTGLARVKLQELVQDYKDKISDQRVTPGVAPSPAVGFQPTSVQTTNAAAASQPQPSLHWVRQAGRAAVLAAVQPPPQTGSDKDKADLEAVLKAQANRTDADRAEAIADQKFKLELMTRVVGPDFTAAHYPIAFAFLNQVRAETDTFESMLQARYPRRRPYQDHPEVKRLYAAEGSGYPSAAAADSRMMTLVVALLFREDAAPLLERDKVIAQSCINAGVNYPSDVIAGRALAHALLFVLQGNPIFMNDLARAQAEVNKKLAEGTHP